MRFHPVTSRTLASTVLARSGWRGPVHDGHRVSGRAIHKMGACWTSSPAARTAGKTSSGVTKCDTPSCCSAACKGAPTDTSHKADILHGSAVAA